MNRRQLFHLTDPAAGDGGNPLRDAIKLIRSEEGGFAVPLPTADNAPVSVVCGKFRNSPTFFLHLKAISPTPPVFDALRQSGAICISISHLGELSD